MGPLPLAGGAKTAEGGVEDRFFWLGAAWVKSRAERPSVSEASWQLHVQIGCKLTNRTERIDKASKRNKLRIETRRQLSMYKRMQMQRGATGSDSGRGAIGYIPV